MEKMHSENTTHAGHSGHAAVHGAHGSVASYTIGFVLSLLLTLAAYVLVEMHVNYGSIAVSSQLLLPAILALAILQFAVQTIFFLHLHRETGPRWNLAIFMSTVCIVFIIVGGSLWIMEHLDYNMTPAQMNVWIMNQE